jgi:hypothetical protein
MGLAIGGGGGGLVGGVVGAVVYGKCVEKVNRACRKITAKKKLFCDPGQPQEKVGVLDQNREPDPKELENAVKDDKAA